MYGYGRVYGYTYGIWIYLMPTLLLYNIHFNFSKEIHWVDHMYVYNNRLDNKNIYTFV